MKPLAHLAGCSPFYAIQLPEMGSQLKMEAKTIPVHAETHRPIKIQQVMRKVLKSM